MKWSRVAAIGGCVGGLLALFWVGLKGVAPVGVRVAHISDPTALTEVAYLPGANSSRASQLEK